MYVISDHVYHNSKQHPYIILSWCDVMSDTKYYRRNNLLKTFHFRPIRYKYVTTILKCVLSVFVFIRTVKILKCINYVLWINFTTCTYSLSIFVLSVLLIVVLTKHNNKALFVLFSYVRQSHCFKGHIVILNLSTFFMVIA
jgi:hypothetical protein